MSKRVQGQPESEIPSQLLEPWGEIPEHYVSVFHRTDKESLETISNEGLTHFSDRIPESQLDISQKHRIAFDAMCDEIAEKLNIDFRRSKAIFAAATQEGDKGKWQSFGDITLEIKIDPGKTLVFDRALYSAAQFAYYKTPEGRKWLEEDPDFQPGSENRNEVERMIMDYPESHEYYIEQYLQKGVELSDFLSMSDAERENAIERPEVALTETTPTNRIRAKL